MENTQPAPSPVAGLLAKIEEKSAEIAKMAKMADFCGHPDREGNDAGYCAECWALFRAEQGLDPEGDVEWDRVQTRLANLLDLPEQKDRVLKRRMKALKAKMVLNLPIYADLHLEAAKIAAAEGDAKPAQWALEKVGIDGENVIDAPKAGDKNEGGVKVVIGVKVAGVPETAVGIAIEE